MSLRRPTISAAPGLMIGLDVGSTTVKAVCVDTQTRQIVWSDYQRHETRQAEKALELLKAIHARFLSPATTTTVGVFITGSGATPLVEPLGGHFVQEVNAVTLAVESLHPTAGSVIELGGQDAKIIIFKKDPNTGAKQVICSMNDKCASGTGATIDKCLIKVGLAAEQVIKLRFNDAKLHKVAAKCGVFAETDIVNLIKAGIPAEEVLCSLANAIVGQNLSVLTRGNTLLQDVVLLGGPNTYLPFLQDCWRLRIPETWKQRNYSYPSDRAPDHLILVPENSQYYAAYGAVLYGLELPQAQPYQGYAKLQSFIDARTSGHVSRRGGPPLVTGPDEIIAFRNQYRIPDFVPSPFATGATVKAFIGLDGGSTSSKAVLIDDEQCVLAKAYRLSKGNPIQDMRDLLYDLKTQVAAQGAKLEVIGFGVTGYAGDILEKVTGADVNVVETVAHMISAKHFFQEVDVICDVGGQDIKVLMMQKGDIKDFRLSNQCSAGNGMLLQAMADQFGVPIKDYADTAFRARVSPIFSYGCAVFLDGDRVNLQREGYSKEELLAGLATVLPKNIWQYVVQIPRMAALGTKYVLQGGTQYNLAAVKAQVDYIRQRVPNSEVKVHPHCGEAGAIGAALEAKRLVQRRGNSKFIGMERALAIEYLTRNDETTRCHFCRNNCARTFVDVKISNQAITRHISGFSCEKGTVESKEAMLSLARRRQDLKEKFVNLLEYEANLAFRSFYVPKPLPEAGTALDDIALQRGLLGIRRQRIRRAFLRSNIAAQERRRNLCIGMPRVLNFYSTAPLFRTYFQTLGLPPENIRFSPTTSEEMFQEGAKYGSVDPCYPSKVVQAHLHALLFKIHTQKPLDYIFFPSITHMPTFVSPVMDSASCPIVAGTPNVIKAGFTKEVNFFSDRGIDYVDHAVNLEERSYFKHQMFEMWRDRLGITEDESDFAVEEGWTALQRFTTEMERRGREILERVEAENKVALLVLGRPYHADPGLNHGLLEEFQALGYPILTILSIPKDPDWLKHWFVNDKAGGRTSSPLDIRDVWPENYSTNSVQKVWAAKFAARHPHVAVLDLSSFKCGHDAPTYGLINDIITASDTPYLAMHDLDANKPAGSQKIRVNTYAYTLQRYQEMLEDRAKSLSELERSIANRRRQLIKERQHALAEAHLHVDDEMEAVYRDFLAQERSIYGLPVTELDKPFPFSPPKFDLIADIAPLPSKLQTMVRSGTGVETNRGSVGCSACSSKTTVGASCHCS